MSAKLKPLARLVASAVAGACMLPPLTVLAASGASNDAQGAGADQVSKIDGSSAVSAAVHPAATVDSARAAPLGIPRAATPPQLRDYLHGIPPQAGLEISDFRQRTPGDGIPVSQPTRAFLSYDATHFYAVFVIKDDPKQIRARIARREAFEGDDYVTLDLDTFHDRRRAFTFFVNPHGVQLDARRTEGQALDIQFDTQWQSEGMLTPDGYLVKLAIPFKSLRFEARDVQTWGIALGRVIARNNEEAYWPHLSKRVAGVVPQYADMVLPEKLAGGRNLQLNPYLYLGRSHMLDASNPARPAWHDAHKLQGGLDAKWVPSEATSVDLTLKPDFSEVDSDEPQVLIDQRYEVLFPEKRPFFLENADLFATPNPLFFSRRISQPRAGLRFTGRADGWAWGALAIDDQAPGKLATSPGAIGKIAKIGVMRVQNDVSKTLSLGAMLTTRRFADERNRVFGLDARYQLDENWVLQAQLASSHSSSQSSGPGGSEGSREGGNRDAANGDNSDGSSSGGRFGTSANGVSRSGHLRYLEASHKGKSLEYTAKYLDIGAGFDTALGFLPRTNLKQLHQDGKYLWHYEQHPWLQNAGMSLLLEGARDQHNVLQDWKVEAGVLAAASHSSWAELYASKGYENFAGQDFAKHGWLLSLGSSWWSWLELKADLGQNQQVNYAPAAGNPAFAGAGRSANLGLVFKPHAQWQLEEKLLWNDLRTQAAGTGSPNGSTVYRNLLLRSKLSYQYDRFWSVRLILDYHSLASNARLSSLKPGKQLDIDLRLSYLLSPGTTLYAGYASRHENLTLGGNPQQLQATPGLDLQTGRQVFIKVSYLFQP